ncbi:MAG: efflux RND transporter periplasmic adaptor subunit [Methylophilaceae bacterium]
MKAEAELILEFQATLLSHPHFDEAATAFATELALRLGFDRVAIGLVERGQVAVKAISHSADVLAKYEAHRAIANAMDEAIEQAAVLISTEIGGKTPRILLAHKALARATGNQICTIPLANNHEIYGAITLERGAGTALVQEDIEACETIVSLLGPVLLLRWSEDRPWYKRMTKLGLGSMKRGYMLRRFLFKTLLYAAVVALAVLLFFPVPYNISAPAKLEGLIQRALVAPESGFLEKSYARPGDRVKAGQVLAELSDQELQLEKRKWASELAQHENAYGAALAQSDRVQLVINQSKADEARSQLELTEQKLARSRMVAPFDGIIIKGDLRQLLGTPVQRGDVLLTIAPVDAYRLMIEVDERDVSYVQAQQGGRVALVSLPDKTLSFHVLRITPVATTKEGRNFFDVEAALTNPAQTFLRPGLEGVAKINAGNRPFIWIWTHRGWDAVRMALWNWGLL